MQIVYAKAKLEAQCTSLKEARKFFGGDHNLAVNLLSRINAINEATVLKDIICTPNFHFHALQGPLKGLFAIDVKSRKDKWRLILQPLDAEGNEFNPCRIDEIATVVTTVRIKEISPHYE